MPQDKTTTDLAAEIEAKRHSGQPTEADILVDERIFARVTDGIYREPSSALRELISNAYDADATRVVILTDPPKFERIVVRDNGIGMDAESLAHFLTHIGGSTKRTRDGSAYGTTSSADPDLSPGGRRLIGKIGIGLFSVAQLTKHLQIITKRRDDEYRLSAEIILDTYSEEKLRDADGEEYRTGRVSIVSSPAEDVQSQGTEVILLNLRPQAQDLLSSRERWKYLLDPELAAEARRTRPTYHIGRPAALGTNEEAIAPQLPWTENDPPEIRFRKLFDAVQNTTLSVRANPTLEDTLDTYLESLWKLSLSAPVDYIEKHPFDATGLEGLDIYKTDADKGTAPEPLTLNGGTVREALALKSGANDPLGGITVLVDNVELRRPIAIRSELLGKGRSIKSPMLFVGKCDSPLRTIPYERGGGPLSFEFYIYWNDAIVPKDNNGVLTRISNASGTLFDPTFFDYPILDATRLRQLSAEIFIREGLDAALNIDRESFNFSHPHYQYLAQYLHATIRKVTNRLKYLGNKAAEQNREAQSSEITSRVDSYTSSVWQRVRPSESEEVGDAIIAKPNDSSVRQRNPQTPIVFWSPKLAESANKVVRLRDKDFQAKVKALVSILRAYGLYDELDYNQQQTLIEDIIAVFAMDSSDE